MFSISAHSNFLNGTNKQPSKNRLNRKPENFKSYTTYTSVGGLRYEMIKSRAATGEKLDTKHHLGRGGYGKVVLAKSISDQNVYAAKKIKLRPGISIDTIQKEINIALRVASHPGVIKLHDVAVVENTKSEPMIIVFSELIKEAKPFNFHFDFSENLEQLNEFYLLAQQIAGGLNHCLETNIVHGDVKPGNLLIGKGTEGDFVAKVIDFGLSREVQEIPDTSFSPSYVAPERVIAFNTLYPSLESIEGLQDVDAILKQAISRSIVTEKHYVSTNPSENADFVSWLSVDYSIQKDKILEIMNQYYELNQERIDKIGKNKEDVFSFGVVLFETLSGGVLPQSLFIGKDEDGNDCYITKNPKTAVEATGQLVLLSEEHIKMSVGYLSDQVDISDQGLLELIDDMLNPNPYDRISMSQVIERLSKLIGT
ncbi:hypothetical protein DID80_07440 [Candidatus Marinamargulisbacteria bacterium SCGC AAA071-K20]|nr:hypothetical protein DID80_07440 [Candidatus Marinamargulisbacteria bacterium SCGC AAA071-K20]